MPSSIARVGQLETITEDDIEAKAEVELAPQPLTYLSEIVELFPVLTLAAQEAIYLVVIAYASLACVC